MTVLRWKLRNCSACLICFLSALLTFALSPGDSYGASPENSEPTFSLSVGAEFSSGTYNAGETTRSFYLPLVISWYPTERYDLSVELPFLYQSSDLVTTSLYHASIPATSGRSVARRGGPGGTMSSGSTGGSGSAGDSSAAGGLGDIILRAGYVARSEGETVPRIRLSLFLKAPTASRSEGLGTGEIDYGGGLDCVKRLGALHLAAEVLYTIQGRVDGFGLQNYASSTVSAGYQLGHDLLPMLVLKGSTAPAAASGSLLEVRGRLLWNLTDRTALDGYIARGITDSSPDYGAGLAAIYLF